MGYISFLARIEYKEETMIDNRYGKYIPVCDICDEELEPQDTYEDAIKAKSNEGWRSKKIDSDWIDVCPNCQ